MGKQTPISKTFEMAGRTYTIETGKLAALADGSVMVRTGNTMLLATVCSDHKIREGQSFFPLSVEYREKFASAGRIPGNFFKRETRPSDYEVLICRLIDRACRPLFPDTYMNETQVFVTLISAEAEVLPDALAAFAASAAFMVSDIPFQGPISEVRVIKIGDEFFVNPSKSEQQKAELDVIVAGSMTDIMMVEGEAKECSEKDMVEAIKFAHGYIKQMCQAQIELREMVGITTTREIVVAPSNDELKKAITELARNKIYEVAKAGTSKMVRKEKFAAIEEETKVALLEKFGEEFMAANGSLVNTYLYKLNKETIREMILADRARLDGRKLDEIRNIWCEVDYLPSAHGSSLFTRGETQALATVTLGTKEDAALIDNALEEYDETFLLHYNFPPYSTGEVKPIRGTSRREVGHGNLARRSLYQMLPETGYTIRVVSDVLESNGSSSMATVCSGSLALFDAGIQMKAPVAGIAMGLISDEAKRYAILSDILGDEDHLGDMDFKVTGTEKGIVGCQMDMKIDGMPYEWLESALEQARQGRLHILGKMNEVMNKPNEDLKAHAPRLVVVEVPADYIGKIIGPGGKHIQGLQRETNTVISIEDKGTKGIVTIASANGDDLARALAVIKGMTAEPEVDMDYEGKVIKLMPFGAFVEFMPGKEGLVHVSEMAWHRVDNPEDMVQEGQTIMVRFLGLDEKNGKMRLSMKALTEKPEGYVERPPRPQGDRDRGPRDDRGPRRDDRRGPPRR